MSQQIKVLDTYLRALKRLSNLRNEIDLLAEGVAEQEADALRHILAQLTPLLPSLVRPISIREPWLSAEHERHYREEGLVLVRSFEQAQGDDGRVSHHARLVLLTAVGRLLELVMEGAWREGKPPRDTSWRVEGRTVEVDAEFARLHLRGILAGILDALKEALARGRAERAELKRRLELLQEVDTLLRKT